MPVILLNSPDPARSFVTTRYSTVFVAGKYRLRTITCWLESEATSCRSAAICSGGVAAR